MKKRNLCLVLVLIISSAIVISCQESCEDKGMLECESGTCCGPDFPWTDGHGTCYSTVYGCREAGWACTRCW